MFKNEVKYCIKNMCFKIFCRFPFLLCAILHLTLDSEMYGNILYIYSDIDTSEYLANEHSYNLLIASEKGYTREIKQLLDKGAEINHQTYEGVTPLMYATINGHKDAVKVLLEEGADPDIAPYDGKTPLIVASQKNNLEIGELLLQYDANTNKKDAQGVCAIHYASAYDFFYFTDMLMFYGADPYIQDPDGNNALMVAVIAGNKDIVDLFIYKGMDIERTDNRGVSPLMMAAQHGYFEIVRGIVEAGGGIDRKDDRGMPVIGYAIKNGQKGIVQYFLNNGISADHRINATLNLLDFARLHNQKEIQELLINHGAQSSAEPSFNKLRVGTGINFSGKDAMFGIETGIFEGKYKFDITLFYLIRLSSIPVLRIENDKLFYQYYENRSVFGIGMKKYFDILDPGKGRSAGIFLGIRGAYTYGRYKGSDNKPKELGLFIPETGIFYEIKDFKVELEYMRADFLVPHFPQNRIKIGLSYNFNISKYGYHEKELSWE